MLQLGELLQLPILFIITMDLHGKVGIQVPICIMICCLVNGETVHLVETIKGGM